MGDAAPLGAGARHPHPLKLPRANWRVILRQMAKTALETEALDILGGARAVRAAAEGFSVELGDLHWVSIIRHGLPAKSFEATAEAYALPQAELAKALGLVVRTLQRRLAKRDRLTHEESERSIRAARALAKANAVLGRENGRDWLREPSRALGGATPLSLLDTADGFTRVMDELGRIEHGVFS